MTNPLSALEALREIVEDHFSGAPTHSGGLRSDYSDWEALYEAALAAGGESGCLATTTKCKPIPHPDATSFLRKCRAHNFDYSDSEWWILQPNPVECKTHSQYEDDCAGCRVAAYLERTRPASTTGSGEARCDES